jgi:hypothetical protein
MGFDERPMVALDQGCAGFRRAVTGISDHVYRRVFLGEQVTPELAITGAGTAGFGESPGGKQSRFGFDCDVCFEPVLMVSAGLVRVAGVWANDRDHPVSRRPCGADTSASRAAASSQAIAGLPASS